MHVYGNPGIQRVYRFSELKFEGKLEYTLRLSNFECETMYVINDTRT